ncbi:MAG: hypothetical protein Q8P67_02605, partial [archaeon]|nr:hypothetical protein [archaeon]
ISYLFHFISSLHFHFLFVAFAIPRNIITWPAFLGNFLDGDLPRDIRHPSAGNDWRKLQSMLKIAPWKRRLVYSLSLFSLSFFFDFF